MFNVRHSVWAANMRLLCFLAMVTALLGAEDLTPAKPPHPKIAAASEEAELTIKKFRIPPGFKADLFAAEPDLANPVAFTVDEQGRFYVVETFRLGAGVMDIRSRKDWSSTDYVQNLSPEQKASLPDELLNVELASRSVQDRIAMYKKYMASRIPSFQSESERIQLIEDRNGDGKADFSRVFSEGYNHMEDGLAAGVLARKGNVYFTCIPDLWLLRDTDRDGVADVKKSLSTGYGVRLGFIGHDLHGLKFGPDGRLYFTIGDRGAVVQTMEGKTLSSPDTGAVFRCNPDGTQLEIFATGLRNPQELAFDQYGNLWTGDNNSDSGDKARWVYLVEGGDSGWRVGYQFMERPYTRGAFNAEKLWYPHFEGQAAYIVPPIANIADGPSGLAYNPGTGLPAQYNQHFFLVDFRGGPTSRILSFAVKPKGAYFDLVDRTDLVSGCLPTDVDFGLEGGIYWSDWVQGWDMTGQGRIYHLFDPDTQASPILKQTKASIREGMSQRSIKELTALLSHADMRVRQEAQFELAERSSLVRHAKWSLKGRKSNDATKALLQTALHDANQLARLHALWGLGQINRELPSRNRSDFGELAQLEPLLRDPDAEIRAQTAKLLAEGELSSIYPTLIALLADSSERVRFFAAMALGKLKVATGDWPGAPSIVGPIFDMLKANNETDPYLRHAGVMALVWNGDPRPLIAAATNQNVGIRLASIVALRRLHRPEVSHFLKDSNPLVTLEAARAINDVPIDEATPELADMIGKPTLDEAMLRRVINANFYVGSAKTAQALAAFGGRGEGPESMRAEALAALGEWVRATGRDHITGLWRPVPKRDPAVAGNALRPVLEDVLSRSPSEVRLAGIRAAGLLGVMDANPTLFGIVSRGDETPAVRLEALKAMSVLQSPELGEAVQIAAVAGDEALRKEATRLQAQVHPNDATTKLAETLQSGSLGERQAALESLGNLQDPSAEPLLSQWLDKFLAGNLPKELGLDVLEATGKRHSAMLQDKFAQYKKSLNTNDPMAGFQVALYGGDPEAGKKVFLERPEASCVRCHKINGEGGEVGPVLTGIASRQPRQYLLESVIYPNKEIAKGFETLLVTLKGGSAYAGIVKSQNDKEIVLNSPEDGLVTIKRDEIQSTDRGLSPMPEGLGTVLTLRDLRDLVEFLASLK